MDSNQSAVEARRFLKDSLIYEGWTSDSDTLRDVLNAAELFSFELVLEQTPRGRGEHYKWHYRVYK